MVIHERHRLLFSAKPSPLLPAICHNEWKRINTAAPQQECPIQWRDEAKQKLPGCNLKFYKHICQSSKLPLCALNGNHASIMGRSRWNIQILPLFCRHTLLTLFVAEGLTRDTDPEHENGYKTAGCDAFAFEDTDSNATLKHREINQIDPTHYFTLFSSQLNFDSYYLAGNETEIRIFFSRIRKLNTDCYRFEYFLKNNIYIILWFQLLKCEYSLVSFLLCDSKLIIFGSWTKQDIWGRRLGLWETRIYMFYHLLTFYKQNN